MSHLDFNEETDYSEENTCNNEVFRSTILHHRKDQTYSQFSCRFITYSIRIGNLDWCKCGLCYREVDAMLTALAKIPEREGSILPFSFYGHLPDYSHTC